jgi:dihydroorotase
MYDLVIANGHVIDPAQGISATLDVGVQDGRIAAIAPGLPAHAATQRIDATGKIVAPGLVDLHAHVYWPGRQADVDPHCGVGAGVTSIVDAGSALASDLAELSDRVVATTKSSIYAFVSNHWWPDGYSPPREPGDLPPIDVDAIVAAARANPDLVKGVKVAVTPAIRREYGLRPIAEAREAARAAGLRLMLHIGDIGNPALPATPSDVTAEAIGLLQQGDILTHVYSPIAGGPLDEDERVLPALRAARDRGVVMDAARGDYGFGWDAADRVIADGIRAHTVSSDFEVHAVSTQGSGLMVENRRATGERIASEITLVEYMSYFLELGFSVEDIIRMTTVAPARAAGIADVAGDLATGKPADISVLELREGRFALADVTAISRVGRRAFVPFATVKRGVVHAPSAGARAWGFTPPRLT